MILIITLNPLLERRFTCQKILRGQVNRDAKMIIAAGGKGINVSRQLKTLGVKSFNFIFSGGHNGKLFREILKNEGLEFSFISTKSETREASVIISEVDKEITSCFSHNPQITSAEVEEFKLKLEKMIQNCEIVIFSGSPPSGKANSIIPFGIDIANKYDKVSICDTYGIILQECINASPTI
jgi:fructose-1-phosphate kinase PfkB-like protein